VFIEQRAEARQAYRPWLEALARRHPRGFEVLLVLLVIVVALGLLYTTGEVTILYEGF
jgi:hypothetical protein